MKYYAALNIMNAANTWEVLVFSNKKSRNCFVEKQDGSTYRNNLIKCLAITKKQVTGYASNLSLNDNCMIKPEPFSGEYWGICYNRGEEIDGYIGDVVVAGAYDNIDRLF